MDASRVLAPGQGETIRPGFEIKVGRPELVVTEAIYAPGDTGPDPHVHHDHVDSFFVLEGELEWQVGPGLEPHRGGPGAFVLVPRDVLHSFRNPGPEPARFLNIHAPGLGFERYLRGDFPEFDQHYLPAGSGLPPDGLIVLGPGESERLAEVEQLAASVAAIDGDSQRPPEGRLPERLESFYVLDGELRLIVEGEESAIPADGFASVAPGSLRALAAPRGPVRFLHLLAPVFRHNML